MNPYRSKKRKATQRPLIKHSRFENFGKSLTPAQRTALKRFTMIGTIGVLLVGVAAWAPPRLDVSPGPNPPELEGEYLTQPVDDVDGARPSVFVIRLEPHGRLHTDYVRFSSVTTPVGSGINQFAGQAAWWRLERSTGLIAIFRPTRLCVRGVQDEGTCVRVDWDASTRSLTLGGPGILRSPDRAFLARLHDGVRGAMARAMNRTGAKT
jgi:hypothetical protein